MKKKPFFKRASIPLLPGTFAICVADTMEEGLETVCKKHLHGNLKADGEDACFVRNGGRFAAVFQRKLLKRGPIAHELLHATARILEYACVHASHDNAETACYLNEWLHNWTYAVLKKGGERVLEK